MSLQLENDALNLLGELKGEIKGHAASSQCCPEMKNSVGNFMNLGCGAQGGMESQYRDTAYQDRYQDTAYSDHYKDSAGYRDGSR
ncbi:MAG: hypothetical protein D3925_01905 [Candidatus Electrothrix sp. AR5]|nr:hypothetical protein [Candidatus Electrothrix sp. AR5]